MDYLVAQLVHFGALFVGANVLIEQLGVPVPAVPTLVIAGALAGAGKLNPLTVFVAGVLASMLADHCWYFAGRRYGYQILKTLCRISLSPDTCVRETEGIFERWGFYSLVVSKFIPGFAAVGPPIAGALRMPLWRFTSATLASASLWVGVAMCAGWLFTAPVLALLAWTTAHGMLAGVLVGGTLGAYVAFKGWQRWRLAQFVQASRITVDELKERFSDDEKPFLVDVGSALAHQSRPHIIGARLMDLDQIVREAHSFPADRDIIFYCACPNEESSKRAAQILRTKGFKRVRPLVGGIDAWIAAGGDVEPEVLQAA
jgi:membrane protein DedA with SNARE-associated domain/rhodanese-related sulfurtransferase